MLKKKIFVSLFVFLTTCLVSVSAFIPQNAFADNNEEYYLCHRCGLKVRKDYPVTVSVTGNKVWHETCLTCAILDILEDSDGNGSITAFGERSKKKIEIDIKNGEITRMSPGETIFLNGGAPYKSLLFIDSKSAAFFKHQTPWTREDMFISVPEILKRLKNQTVHITNCALCGCALKEEENSIASIVTKNHRKILLCSTHCALQAVARKKSEIQSVTVKDHIHGDPIDARRAYFLLPKTFEDAYPAKAMAFKLREDAIQFQKGFGEHIFRLSDTWELTQP